MTQPHVNEPPAGAVPHPPPGLPPDLEAFLDFLQQLPPVDVFGDELPPEDTPRGKLTRKFFKENWEQAQDLLSKTDRLELEAEASPWPRRFRFTVHTRFKAKPPGGAVELREGPVTGEIVYRADPYSPPPEPGMPNQVVRVDPHLCLFHPNHKRGHGGLCLGDLPGGAPMPLTPYFLVHVYGVLTYTNYRAFHPLDMEAAHYFATDPEALAGLQDPPPLY